MVLFKVYSVCYYCYKIKFYIWESVKQVWADGLKFALNSKWLSFCKQRLHRLSVCLYNVLIHFQDIFLLGWRPLRDQVPAWEEDSLSKVKKVQRCFLRVKKHSIKPQTITDWSPKKRSETGSRAETIVYQQTWEFSHWRSNWMSASKLPIVSTDDIWYMKLLVICWACANKYSWFAFSTYQIQVVYR